MSSNKCAGKTQIGQAWLERDTFITKLPLLEVEYSILKYSSLTWNKYLSLTQQEFIKQKKLKLYSFSKTGACRPLQSNFLQIKVNNESYFQYVQLPTVNLKY